MSLRPIKRLLVVGSMLLFSIGPAPAQTPSPEAISAARSLVATLKLTEQYKALLPAILLGIKPALTQDRPEIESDFEVLKPKMAEAYTPYYNAMVDGIAAVYAANFSLDELRELDAFYRRPAGQKFLEKWPCYHAAERADRRGRQSQGRRGPADKPDPDAAPEGAKMILRHRRRHCCVIWR